MSKKTLLMEVLTILLALVIPFTAFAESTGASDLVSGAALSKSGAGVAEWSDVTSYEGSWSIHLVAPGKATWDADLGKGVGVNEGRISIKLAPGTTLGDIESISWWVNTTSGYPPHVDLLLDLDGDGVFDGGKKHLVTGKSLSGDDDVLVAEFAYQPYFGPGYAYSSPGVPYGHYVPEWQSSYYYPMYDTWVKTFQNVTDEIDTTQVNNETAFWLYSGLPGPYSGGYFGMLADFKDGVVRVIGGTDVADVDASTVVLEIQIEVDNWLGPAEAYVDDVAINGETLLTELTAPEIVVKKPDAIIYPPGDIPIKISTYDLFGVTSVWYNVKNSAGDWVYATNRTYTATTIMPDFADGYYHFYAWAENTLGIVDVNSEIYFTVLSRGLTIDIKPDTLNLRSRGRWITVFITPPEGYDVEDIDISTIKLEFGDNSVEVDWVRVQNVVLMVKFSRSAVKEMLSPGDEVEIIVTGKLKDGTPFGGSDTIRVIEPGNAFGRLRNTRSSGNSRGQGTGLGKGNKGGHGKGHGNEGGKGKTK